MQTPPLLGLEHGLEIVNMQFSSLLGANKVLGPRGGGGLARADHVVKARCAIYLTNFIFRNTFYEVLNGFWSAKTAN